MKIIRGTGCLVALLALISCGKVGGPDGGRSGGNNFESSFCEGGGWCGDEAVSVTANLSGAKALMILEGSSNASSSASAITKGGDELTISSNTPGLFAVTSSGFQSVFSASTETISDSQRALAELPALSAVVVNKYGDALFIFKHSYMFKTEGCDFEGAQNPDSICTCQIYYLNKRISDIDADNPPQLLCVDPNVEVDTWSWDLGIAQVANNTGDFFVSLHEPNNWKNRLARINTSDWSIDYLTHGNECFREVTVGPNGDVLFAGVTDPSGECHGTGWTRYITTDGDVVQIAQGTYEYSAFVSEHVRPGEIFFYGQDVTKTFSSWGDACGWWIDPEKSGTERSQAATTCDQDPWSTMQEKETLPEQRTFCKTTQNSLGGYRHFQKGFEADVDGDGTYNVLLVTDYTSRAAGEWRCDFCIDNGTQYCTNSAGDPTSDVTSAACTATNGNTWNTSSGTCFNQISTNACEIADDGRTGWNFHGQWCETKGDWMRNISGGLVQVDSATELTIHSGENQLVTDAFLLKRTSGATNDTVAMSVYNATEGQFEVKIVGRSDPILTGYECYEILRDPRDSNKLLANCLKFSGNQFLFITVDLTTLDVTEEENLVGGQAETLFIVPDLI